VPSITQTPEANNAALDTDRPLLQKLDSHVRSDHEIFPNMKKDIRSISSDSYSSDQESDS